MLTYAIEIYIVERIKIMNKKIAETKPKDSTQNFEAQFKRSTTPLLVLFLLSQKEMYAYDIIRETLSLSNNVYKMPLLYTVLNKLESDGYVTQSQRIISKDNRVRVYYKITDDGRHYLTELTNTYFSLSDAVNSILFGGENDESHN